ncbi:hypothetical protein MUP00_12930 [Candidatus Bathyarchaeota archaeon]|nr:hypothetical protein [Candidatus Bathyarchaeota archaeon]
MNLRNDCNGIFIDRTARQLLQVRIAQMDWLRVAGWAAREELLVLE